MFAKANIKSKMAAVLRQPEERLVDEALLSDLVEESFALIEMMIELQEEFGVRVFVQDDFKEVHTVGELIALIEKYSATALTSSSWAPPGPSIVQRTCNSSPRRV
jgi:acyl carrier protein